MAPTSWLTSAMAKAGLSESQPPQLRFKLVGVKVMLGGGGKSMAEMVLLKPNQKLLGEVLKKVLLAGWFFSSVPPSLACSLCKLKFLSLCRL